MLTYRWLRVQGLQCKPKPFVFNRLAVVICRPQRYTGARVDSKKEGTVSDPLSLIDAMLKRLADFDDGTVPAWGGGTA